MSRKIIVAGGTGFIGQALCHQLLEQGHKLIVLTRDVERSQQLFSQKVTLAKWDGRSIEGWYHHVDGTDAIINLTGENIGSWRWTEAKKQRILESRLQSGAALMSAMAEVTRKPKIFIQASGIGIYGNRHDEVLDESSVPGTGFMAELAQKWEQSVQAAKDHGARVVYLRTGVVLGKGASYLKRVTLPFRYFVGGHLGSGKQWISWIHLDDQVAAILFLLERDDLEGPFNLSSPNPLPASEFCKILGRVMNRPCWLHVPSLVLKLALGEMANELILAGQRAIPARLLKAGFGFRFPDLQTALTNILTNKPGR